MSEPTLEPCPFCGSKCFFNHEDVTNSRGEEYTRAWVECTGCDMRSITKRVVYGVPAAKVMLSGLWNKRAPATTPADAALADDALCESLIEASDMRWNGDVYVGDGSDLMSLVRAALRARTVPEGKKYHDVAQRLYALLDDIDTAGDIAKSDDKLYRGIVERTQAKKRDFVVSCDGYTVTLADDSMLAASKEGGTNG